MALIDTAASLGADLGPANSLAAASAEFNNQNLSPQDIFGASLTIPSTVGGIPGIGSSIPGLGRIPLPGIDQFPNVIAPINELRLGVSGSWHANSYAADLNAHHPKFKFLFKVGFYGFTAQDFYYYVHRVDKPKVRLNHADINYYNFRTRVLTHITYEPLSVTFLDEIGNSVNAFFASYMQEHSGQADGNFGIDRGIGAASSMKPYSNGYSSGRRIVVEQIFANGVMSNRFIFTNPRIETFDFDELNMDDSMGSLCTLMFSYDALTCETVAHSRLHGWGQTDLLKGGGTSGQENAGNTGAMGTGSLVVNGEVVTPTSALGGSMPGISPIAPQPGIAFLGHEAGMKIKSLVPSAVSDIATSQFGTLVQGTTAGISGIVGSAETIVNREVKESLISMQSGANLKSLIG